MSGTSLEAAAKTENYRRFEREPIERSEKVGEFGEKLKHPRNGIANF